MARSFARVAAAGGAVVLALCARPLPTLGDPGTGSTLGAPSSVAAGHPFAVQARFVRAQGGLLEAGVPVVFSQTGAPASACVARFDPQFTITDATGAASAQATLPPGCPGPFVLAATAAGAGSVSTTTTETGGGFPDTTADRPPSPLPPSGGGGRPRGRRGLRQAAHPAQALSSDPPPGRGRPTSPARGEGPSAVRREGGGAIH